MTYSAERYARVEGLRSPSFGPNGHIAFVRESPGGQHLWVQSVDRDGRGEQLSHGDHRVVSHSWHPDAGVIVYAADPAGTERLQLFRLAVDDAGRLRDPGDGTAPEERLTDAPTAIHRWGGFDAAGERIAFAANRREPTDFDVYVTSVTEPSADPRLVAEQSGKAEPAGWSPSDDRILVRLSTSATDQRLYSVAVPDGTTRRLTPEGSGVQFESPQWGPDGEAVYCVTDYDAAESYLARVDAETRTVTRVYEDDDRVADGFALSPDGRIVLNYNDDGYTDLVVGRLTDDGRGLRDLSPAALPDGVGGGGSFSPSGDRFALTFPTYRSADIHVVDVETGETTRLARPSRAGIPPSAFQQARLVRFESHDGLTVPAFVTTPADEPEPAPVVVDLHGGPRSQRRPGFNTYKQYLVDSGYAVVEPNVRGSTGYGEAYATADDGPKRLDAVGDVIELLGWIDDEPGLDGDRVALGGASYGGYLALTTAAAVVDAPGVTPPVDPGTARRRVTDAVGAVISNCGITDLVTFLETTSEWRRERRTREYGDPDEDEAFLRAISPLSNVDRIEAPVLVVHGENDPRVPVSEARQLVSALSDHDTPTETLIFEDEGHGLSDGDNRVEMHRTVASFLAESL